MGRPINEQLAVLLVANPATEKKDRERRERAFNPIAMLVETVNLANVVGSGSCAPYRDSI